MQHVILIMMVLHHRCYFHKRKISHVIFRSVFISFHTGSSDSEWVKLLREGNTQAAHNKKQDIMSYVIWISDHDDPTSFLNSDL